MDNEELKEKEQKGIEELLKKIDNIELIPDEEIKNMDFYQLSYYMQTLNMIDSLEENKEED